MAGERAWCYLVVSSDAQEETLEAQRRWAYEEAARIGVTVERTFEGVSTGKHGARELLVQLIEALKSTAKTHRPSRVLMVRLDRTGRMPMDAIAALNEIRKLGVIVRTRKDGDLSFARMVDMVAPVFELLQSGFENEVRSDRTKAGFKRRVDEGKLIPTKPPYGVMRDAKGFPAFDPVCGPYVQEVFRRWNNRESPAEIVRWLKAEAPPRQGTHGTYPLLWSLSHLYKMVHTVRTYRGLVVDVEVWDRAQHRSRPNCAPSRPNGRVYPYSGLHCHCGERLHPRTVSGTTIHTKKDGTKVRYERKTPRRWYVCQSLSHPTGPKFRSYNEQKIDKSWLSLLRRLALSNGPWTIRERATNLEMQIATCEHKLKAIEQKQSRVHDAFEAGDYGAETMRSRLAKLADEETRIRTEIRRIQDEMTARSARMLQREQMAELIAYAPKIYEKATPEERSRINRALIAAFGNPVITDDYRVRFPAIVLSRR